MVDAQIHPNKDRKNFLRCIFRLVLKKHVFRALKQKFFDDLFQKRFFVGNFVAIFTKRAANRSAIIEDGYEQRKIREQHNAVQSACTRVGMHFHTDTARAAVAAQQLPIRLHS